MYHHSNRGKKQQIINCHANGKIPPLKKPSDGKLLHDMGCLQLNHRHEHLPWKASQNPRQTLQALKCMH